jgi:ADP-heptose:LPS heptosyltransferase
MFKNIVINCDTHGFGDLMTLSWIAEGAKDSDINIYLYATGNKKKLLETLNQTVVDNCDGAISLEKIFTHDQYFIKKEGYSRINSWKKFFNLEFIKIKKPLYNIDDRASSFANNICKSNTIVLCPESIRLNRQWPNSNWIDLYNYLKNDGYNVVILCYRGADFKHLNGFVNNLTWDKILAIFEKSSLIIGCDSAPIHASGITNTPAIALLGPTTSHVFEHLQYVNSISITKKSMPCVGCWFYEDFVLNPCDFGCVALCSISVEEVYNKAIKILK